jgi:hypothetical protein
MTFGQEIINKETGRYFNLKFSSGRRLGRYWKLIFPPNTTTEFLYKLKLI